VDVQLAWSWDLINWTRPFPRVPFIPNGNPGTFDSTMIYTANAPVLMGYKLFFYYGGFDVPHNSKRFNSAIGIAMIRLDGFGSMQANDNEGWLITHREKITIPEVIINAKTGQEGYIEAEILDLQNNIIPGFSRQDCIPLNGDSIDYKLCWKLNSFTDEQKDTVKKLRFYLREANLYSYKCNN